MKIINTDVINRAMYVRQVHWYIT